MSIVGSPSRGVTKRAGSVDFICFGQPGEAPGPWQGSNQEGRKNGTKEDVKAKHQRRKSKCESRQIVTAAYLLPVTTKLCRDG